MTAMVRSILVIAFLLCPSLAAHAQCPALLVALDDKGRVTRGSKKALVDAAARGDSLRVGWSVKWGKRPHDGVQHWHEAPFVTVFEGEVFTQVPMIHRQDPKPGKRHIALSPELMQWGGLLGTDGLLVSRFTDGAAPREVRVAQTWCLDGAAAIECSAPRWRLVYRHGADGRPRAGSKAALVAAIRRGDPVRVTWRGSRAVEERADPASLSIAGGERGARRSGRPRPARHRRRAGGGAARGPAGRGRLVRAVARSGLRLASRDRSRARAVIRCAPDPCAARRA